VVGKVPIKLAGTVVWLGKFQLSWMGQLCGWESFN
jgi:hypothetical protein